jgi:hypothetical protein
MNKENFIVLVGKQEKMLAVDCAQKVSHRHRPRRRRNHLYFSDTWRKPEHGKPTKAVSI